MNKLHHSGFEVPVWRAFQDGRLCGVLYSLAAVVFRTLQEAEASDRLEGRMAMNLKMIAERAGVSTATVSNVINGNNHKVSRETIERVRRIIEETGYSPSATARSLASQESRIIGVVIPYLQEEENFGENPYTSQILALLEAYVRRQGYYLMLRSVGSCREIIPIASSWNVDGLMILGALPDEAAELEERLKTPAVYMDTYAPEACIANVGINDYRGGFLSAHYLLEKGHRKIAFVGPNPDFPGVVQERYRGFCAALAEWGLVLSPAQIFEAKTTADAGIAVGEQIASSSFGFTAAAAMSDTLALGLMAGLSQGELNVPEDVSVIGFDNIHACRFTMPGLTTVSQDLEAKARLAGDHLFQMIQKKEKLTVNDVLDVELVERQSVRQLNG